jgi:hypothetical protein
LKISGRTSGKTFDPLWGIGVYGSVIPVKVSNRFGPFQGLRRRWRIRRELKRLKADRERLQQDLLQAEQMKSVLTNWWQKTKDDTGASRHFIG